MAEASDILTIANALIKHFGAEAVGFGEARAEAHRRAEESEGAELWQRVADAARSILTGHARTLPRQPS
jgi:hypothetical protein